VQQKLQRKQQATLHKKSLKMHLTNSDVCVYCTTPIKNLEHDALSYQEDDHTLTPYDSSTPMLGPGAVFLLDLLRCAKFASSAKGGGEKQPKSSMNSSQR
jgi:hypothetical protein